MSLAQNPRTYRPDIDGLRAVAIVSVVLFHAGIPFIKGGFIGVDVFFVISGYLIGSLVHREIQNNKFSLIRFYQRRAKRILPAFFLVVAVCYALSVLLLSPKELTTSAAQTLAALTSTSNIYFWKTSNYFSPSAELQPQLMTWSLGVEEQFYLFFPLLMLLLNRVRRRHTLAILMVLSVLSFALSILSISRSPAAAFYLLPSRAWELGLGTILGIYETGVAEDFLTRNKFTNELLSIGGIALLLIGFFTYNGATPFPGLAALLPVVAAMMLLRAKTSWVNTRLLASKPMTSIGLISYSLYLWHWPLLSFARVCGGGLLPLKVGCLIAALSFALATLSYHFVEQPFRHASNNGHHILIRYGVAALVFCVPAVALMASHGWPKRYPAAAAYEQAALQDFPDTCLVGYGVSQPKRTTSCIPKNENRPTLAVMGDSHAAALAAYLRSKSAVEGWQLEDLTKSSCPQLGTVVRHMPNHRLHEQECATYNQAALQQVIGDANVKTVLLAGYWSAPFAKDQEQGRFVRIGQSAQDVTTSDSWGNFSSGLEQTIQLLRSHGKRVLLAVDVPRFPFDPLVRGVGEEIPPRRKLRALMIGSDTYHSEEPQSITVEADDRHATELLDSVGVKSGAEIVDLTDNLCAQSECSYSIDNRAFYVDGQHLSISGAEYALRSINLWSR